MSILDLEPKKITGPNGEELVVLTLTKAEWQALEAKLSADEPMPVFASIGVGESELNGADSETWLNENSSVFQGIVKQAEEQFANGETISPDEFWRKLEGSTDA